MFCSTVILRIGIGKNDAPAIGSDEADDHVKAGRFTCAVWAEQSDDLARPDIHIDPIHHCPAAVDLHQLFGGEDSFFLCRGVHPNFRDGDRRSLANHGFGKVGAGETWAGGVSVSVSPFVSSFGCWRISVRLGPCVVS